MKILSAKVSEPNTPETDMMECVSHDVRVSFHNMANEKTVLSLWPPKPSQSEIETNAVALHQSENPEDYSHPFNPKPAYE